MTRRSVAASTGPEKRAPDLAGADAILSGMEAKALLADKAYDADKRVIGPLAAAGKTVVIPPKKQPEEPQTV